jgi:tetratricopeptide (TPR) repeat protein
LDETSAQLQKQGNYLEALECMERGLVLRQHFFGADSDEVWKACKTVGEMCNLLAMTYLQQEDFNMVLELLKKAEILTERDQAGRAATFNNLACYYRRQGKLHGALQYLQKALKIESKLTTVQNPADTHINACAVLSQLGRHQTALEHAQSALILLQEELLSPPGASTTAPPKADRIAVLAIAYHNIGVEQEFLKRYEQSIISYKKGVEVAERYLGAKHAICITLNNSLVSAKKSATAAAFKLAKAGKGGKSDSSAASNPSKRGTSLERGDHKGSPSPERNISYK